MKRVPDLTLSDGVTEIGFLVFDPNGEPDMREFRTRPLEPLAIKTSTGESAYSDMEAPYFTAVKSDFSGGRGASDFEDDKSKYFDGSSIWPARNNSLILGSAPTFLQYDTSAYIGLYPTLQIANWYKLDVDNLALAKQMTLPATLTGVKVSLVARKVGSPGNLRVRIYNDDGFGLPGARRGSGSGTLVYDTYLEQDVPDHIFAIDMDCVDIASGCWVVVFVDGDADDNNYWEIGCNGDGGADNRTTAPIHIDTSVTWSYGALSMWIHLDKIVEGEYWKFFTYRSGLYALRQKPGTNTKIYRVGDRGYGSIYQDVLTDTAKNWEVDAFAGATLYLIPGNTSLGLGASAQDLTYYLIDGNTSQTLILTSESSMATTNTEYVIVNSSTFTYVSELPGHVSDFEIIGDQVFFAFADGGFVRRWREFYRVGISAWASAYTTERVNAVNLASTIDVDGTAYLYGDVSPYTGLRDAVWVAQVPPAWTTNGMLLNVLGEMDILDFHLWSYRSNANVTMLGDKEIKLTVAAAATGYAGAASFEGINASDADAVVVELMESQNNTVAASAYSVRVSSAPNLTSGAAPIAIAYTEQHYYVNSKSVKHLNGTTWTQVTELIDGVVATEKTFATFGTSDFLYIGSDQKFGGFKVTMGATVNASAATMTVKALINGDEESVLDFVDGTSSGTQTLNVTGAVTFTPPDNWAKWTLEVGTNAVEAYWVKVSVSASLTASMKIAEIWPAQANVIIPANNAIDGDPNTAATIPDFNTGEYLYIADGAKFNQVTFDLGTLNTNTATISGDFWNGVEWTALSSITDGTSETGGKTLGKDGTITWSPPSAWFKCVVNSTEAYWIRLKTSALLTPVSIKSATIGGAEYITEYTPNMRKGEWHYVVVELPRSDSSIKPGVIDASNLRSLGIFINTPTASVGDVLHIRRVFLAKYKPRVMMFDAPVTNIGTYREDRTGGRNNAWVITEKNVYEIQAQNDYAVVEFGLNELKELGGPLTGKAFTTNAVYMYFTLMEALLQRYYSSQLDNVGPESGEGLPVLRRARIKKLLSYPGKVLAMLSSQGKRGSIMYVDGNSWHDWFATPIQNPSQEIHGIQELGDIYHTPIPGWEYGKLYVSLGSLVFTMPLSPNPLQVSQDFSYAPWGWMTTPWFYANLKDVYKVWSRVKLFMQDTDNWGQNIELYYQLDESFAAWNKIGDIFYTTPSHEEPLSVAAPADVRSKRIRFKIVLYTTSPSLTPKLEALLLEGYAVVPVKWEYSWRAIFDVDDSVSMGVATYNNTPIDFANVDLEALNNLLTSWANSGRGLIFNCRSRMVKNKLVVLQQPTNRPFIKRLSDEKNERERWEVLLAVQDL